MSSSDTPYQQWIKETPPEDVESTFVEFQTLCDAQNSLDIQISNLPEQASLAEREKAFPLFERWLSISGKILGSPVLYSGGEEDMEAHKIILKNWDILESIFNKLRRQGSTEVGHA